MNSTMRARILGVAVALALCSSSALGDAVGKPGITAVQAELLADMHARLLKVGTTVYARVTADWRGADCALRSGAILEGHVLSVTPHTKTAKGSEVSLAFTRAQCGDTKMGAFELLLAAMAAPPQNSDLGMLSESVPVQTAGLSGFGVIDSMRASTTVNLYLEVEVYRFPLVPNMRMGYVSGIRGLKLSVGTGPENSSELTSKDHDVSLEKHTLLLLVPAQGTFPRTAANPSAAADSGAAAKPDVAQPMPADASHSSNTRGSDSVAPARLPVQPPIEDIDLCVPPQCSLALPSADVSDFGDAGKAADRISIGELGYAPRPQREKNSFDHDEALAYLGPRELLVAFNRHKLVSRHTLGGAGSTVREVRAALVDTETHRVIRTVDWELPDNRQYLWPLSEGRVLVHVGSELRVYGEGLKILNRVSFDGPLAFMRVTPDGSFMAVGVIRERHSAELHAELSRSLNGDPEEDVNILVLNRNFETIAKSKARSGLMAPTLLNEGQAKLSALPNMGYRISMLTWDNRAWTVARFKSSCTPELSSIAPDLIFLVSCDKQSERHEYRMLHSNGKLALKGDSNPNEGGHAAEGSADQGAFVVKVVNSGLPAAPGEPLSAANSPSEEFGVYRAADGKRLLGVRVGSPSSSREGYALAPDGSQLAVLTRDQVVVYSVPAK